MLAGSKARPECRPALSRRPANGRAQKGRSAVARAEEPEADLFRIQQELISQIEARKSRQADIEEEIKKNAAQRNGVSATIDLDEQYRKTLAKFKATAIENGSGSTANATLAPPPPATSLSKPAPASPASKPPAPPPSVQSKPMPSPSVPTVKPSQFSKPSHKDKSSSGMRPLQPLQPSGATMKPPPAAAPGSMSNAPMRPSGQEQTTAPRAPAQSVAPAQSGPKRNRPVVIPGKPTLPGAAPAPASPPPAPASSPVSRVPAAPSSEPFSVSPVPQSTAPTSAPTPSVAPTPKTPAEPPTPSITTPKPAVETTPTTFTFPSAPAAPSSPVKGQDTASRTTTAMLEELSGPKTTAAPPEAPPPPPAGDNVMNMVFVGAECAPWSKTGGLGDVMGSLPKAMQRRGHRVMVVAPRYGMYDDAFDTGVRQMYRVFDQDVEVGYFHAYIDGVDFVFVDHASYHGRQGGDIYKGDRLEQAFRNSLLCKAALEAVWHVPCGGVPYGDSNTVFIANDWHTSLLPVYLQAHYRDHGKMTYARSVLTIHNMAYQGRGPFAELDNFEIPDNYRDHFFLDDPVGGEHMNILKAAIITASRIVAVSGGYAWEIQTSEGGWGLHEVLSEQNWKLSGIVNGIDEDTWNPKFDQFLTTDGYTQYSPENLFEGKAQNKRALQKELGLPENPDVPMLGFIGRMDYQKGVDFIVESYPWLMGEGVQLVMLGSGREDLENELRNMENQRKDQCRGWVGFSVPMSHRITAACDMLLMPSRFEPCGLNQLYAMKYGTVPIVHAVGGLRETVQQFNPFEKSGTGWQFERAESNAFRDACGNALFTYRQHRDDFQKLQLRGAEQDLSWDKAAEQYEGVFVEAKFQCTRS